MLCVGWMGLQFIDFVWPYLLEKDLKWAKEATGKAERWHNGLWEKSSSG